MILESYCEALFVRPCLGTPCMRQARLFIVPNVMYHCVQKGACAVRLHAHALQLDPYSYSPNCPTPQSTALEA